MENKTLKYIAAICFALIAVRDIVYVITDFYFLNLLPAVGSIFVVIALLTATPIFNQCTSPLCGRSMDIIQRHSFRNSDYEFGTLYSLDDCRN